jgi:hypothetical protein
VSDSLGISSYKSPPALMFKDNDEEYRTWAVDNFITTTELESRFVENDSVLFAVDIEILGKHTPTASFMPSYTGIVATLNGDLAAILNRDHHSFADITLAVEGEKFHCHKCILAARSGFFNRKFQNFTFSAKLLLNRGHYLLNEIEASILKIVIHFIYTDECR